MKLGQHHFKETQALLFVFHQRIPLPVATQANPLSQMVHHQQVVLPQTIEGGKRQDLADVIQDLLTKLVFPSGIALLRTLIEIFADTIAIQTIGTDLTKLWAPTKEGEAALAADLADDPIMGLPREGILMDMGNTEIIGDGGLAGLAATLVTGKHTGPDGGYLKRKPTQLDEDIAKRTEEGTDCD